MSYRSLYWEDVEPGTQLPPIKYELSLLRLVSFVRASGLYDYVHFDRDYARFVGARDAFISTPHVAGLFNRLLTDWAGPECILRTMTFNMNGQSCSGDVLNVTGRVGKKYKDQQGDCLIDLVDLNIEHTLHPHAASATATLALPSRSKSSPALVAPAPPKDAVSQGVDVPAFIKPLLGQPQALQRRIRPVTEDAIHLLCECLEDWNPLYWDKSYAKDTPYGGIIAPPTSLFFGVNSSADAGVGYLKPGERPPKAVSQGLTGLPLLQSLREDFLKANSAFHFSEFPEVVVVSLRSDYMRPIHTGDLLRQTQELVDCGGLKKTKLGEGHFVTIVENTNNQNDQLVKVLTKKAFFYRP